MNFNLDAQPPKITVPPAGVIDSLRSRLSARGLVLSPNDYLQRGFQTTFKIDNMTSFKILSRGTSFKMYHWQMYLQQNHLLYFLQKFLNYVWWTFGPILWQNTKCLFVKWGTETTNVNNVLAPKFFTFEVSYLKMDTPFTWLWRSLRNAVTYSTLQVTNLLMHISLMLVNHAKKYPQRTTCNSHAYTLLSRILKSRLLPYSTARPIISKRFTLQA